MNNNYNATYVCKDDEPLYECRTCGALVVVPGLHNRWHRFSAEDA